MSSQAVTPTSAALPPAPPAPPTASAGGGDPPGPAAPGSPPVAGADDGALAQRASAGMVWLLAQSLGYKVISLFGTIAMTHLISPEHSGEVALALSLAAFSNFLQQPGLREVLIQRRTRQQAWDLPAFWLSVGLGVLAMSITAAAAPLAGWWWRSDEMVNLLLILALAALPLGLAIVPEARLQSQLRFKALAVIEFTRATGLLLTQLGVALAIKHAGHAEWGAYALTAPIPVYAAYRCVCMWWLAGSVFPPRPRLRLWGHLWPNSAKLFSSHMVGQFITQGPLWIMGWRFDKESVGLYSFAFNLSLMTAVLLTQNIASVIFPVLSNLQDSPLRLRSAFLSSARLLNMLAVPACFLQAVLAEPAVRTVCSPKWAGSVGVMQVLSVAMAFVVVWPSSKSLMQAQGRYTLALFMHVVHTVIVLTSVGIAASVGQSGVAVAIAVTVAYAIIGVLDPYMAVRPLGGTLRDVLGLLAAPVLVGLVGVVGVYAGVAWLLPADREYLPFMTRWLTSAYIPQAVVGSLLSMVACAALYRILAPQDSRVLLSYGRKMLQKVLRRG